MSWLFTLGDSVTVADSSALTLPNGDWAIAGWVKISDSSGTTFPRILSWGDNASNPLVLIFYAQAGTGVSNSDYFGALVRDNGSGDTGVIYPNSIKVSDQLDEWVFLCLTHDGTAHQTYFRILDRSSGVYHNSYDAGTLGEVNVAQPLFFGIDQDYTAGRRFEGELADWAFYSGLFVDEDQMRALIHQSRPYQIPSCTMSLPMLRGRYEEWKNQLVVTNNGTSEGTSDPLSRLITPQALNTLPIIDLEPAVSDSLSLNQSVSYITPSISRGVETSLNLTASAIGVRDIPMSLSNDLTLTSTGGRTFTYSANSTISVSDILVYINYVDDRKPVGNTLTLSQLVEAKGSRTVDHVLGLIQTVNVQAPIKPQVSHSLGLVSHTSTPHRAFITQNLNASQFLVTPLPPQRITQNLVLTQEAPIGLFEQTLNLTQAVAFSFSLTATNTLNMTDELNRTVIYIREIEHANVIGHALTWYEDSPCGRKNYTPFQGENTIPGAVTAPRNTLQDPQGDTGNFSLYTPYLGVPTSKVVLRAPELDNRDRNAYSRVNSETRGGKLVVYADPIWPKVRTLVVTIVGLTEAEVDEFQAFMEDTLGQEIGLTDWEGRLWKGYIKNPNEPAVQDGRERWTVSFEFEGEMLTVEQPGNEDGNGMDLNITQSVVAVIV